MRYSIPILAMFMLLFSCKSGGDKTATTPAAQTPEQYVNTIEDLENSLEEPMLKTEAEIKVRSEKNDFEAMAKSAAAAEDSIQLRIDTWEKIKPVGNGGDDFKLVCSRYLNHLKSIYTTYKKVAEAKDDDARAKAADELNNIIAGQPQIQDNLQAALAKYSADNNLR